MTTHPTSPMSVESDPDPQEYEEVAKLVLDDSAAECKTGIDQHAQHQEIWDKLHDVYSVMDPASDNFSRMMPIIDTYESKNIPARVAIFMCSKLADEIAGKYGVSDEEQKLDTDVLKIVCWNRPVNHWAYRSRNYYWNLIASRSDTWCSPS